MIEEPYLLIPVDYRLSSANTRAFFAQGVWLPPHAGGVLSLKAFGSPLKLSSGAPTRKRSPTEEHGFIYHKGSTQDAREAARTIKMRSLRLRRHRDEERKKSNKEKEEARKSDGNALLPGVQQRSKGEKPEWRHKESTPTRGHITRRKQTINITKTE
jgi:hypothetical protein